MLVAQQSEENQYENLAKEDNSELRYVLDKIFLLKPQRNRNGRKRKDIPVQNAVFFWKKGLYAQSNQ